jgi:hypothetical protein
MDMNIVKFAKVMNDLHDDFWLKTADVLGEMVALIAAMGTLLYFGSKIWVSITKNEPIDVYPLIKPVVIIICCMNFSTFVLKPINSIFTPVAGYVVKTVSNNIIEGKEMKQAQRERSEAQRAKRDSVINDATKGSFSSTGYSKLQVISSKAGLGYTTRYGFMYSAKEIKEKGDMSKLSDSDKELLDEIIKAKESEKLDPSWLQEALIGFFVWLFEMLATAIGFLLLTIRTGFLIILSFVGPFAFGLSCFPGYGNNYMNWITKYVSILLWYPVIFIVLNVVSLINTYAGNTLDVALNNGTMAILCSILLSLTTLFMMLSVPTIVSWIIQGAEQAGIAKGIMAMAGAAGGAAGGAALAGGFNAAKRMPLVGNMIDAVGGAGKAVGGGISGLLSKGKSAVNSGVGSIGSSIGKAFGGGNRGSAGSSSISTDGGKGNTDTDGGKGSTITDGGKGSTDTNDSKGSTITGDSKGSIGTDGGKGNTITDGGKGSTDTDGSKGSTITDDGSKGSTGTDGNKGSTGTDDSNGSITNDGSKGSTTNDGSKGSTTNSKGSITNDGSKGSTTIGNSKGIKSSSGIGSSISAGAAVGSTIGQSAVTGEMPKENPLESVRKKLGKKGKSSGKSTKYKSKR